MNTVNEAEEQPLVESAPLALADDVPARARVVIVGGGIVGCSVAYHLARTGWRGVMLLEQTALAGGTTWHAAGMVGQLRTSNSLTRINKYSVELYQRLEAETGVATGWKEVGSLILAQTEARMTQLRRTAAMAGCFGVDARLIDVAEARERWPDMHTDDLLGAVWLPHDGKVDPKATALSLAKGARDHGATIHEHTRVTGLDVADGFIQGVFTETGRIAAEYVVLCGGMWARALALDAGVSIPLHPVEHHYAVSAPVANIHDDLPCTRDPDAQIYFRSEGDCIMLGAFQSRSKAWEADPLPHPFSFALLEPDWEKFAEPLAAGRHRLPALNHTELPKFVNGPESFTPDNNFLMGETPEVGGLFVCAGFNSVGIASAGGAGKYLADWIVTGRPTMDLWSVDVARFMPFHNNRAYLRERVSEVLGLHYQMAWPNREFETGRDLRRSPLHGRLASAGACFGVKMALERPNWFAPPGVKPEMDYAFGKPAWLDHSGREHGAARENVALFDQSSFSTYRFEGRDAVTVLQRTCGANVDVAPGRCVYTGMFNVRGTYESDLMVVRLAERSFYLVTSSTQTRHDYQWITRNIAPGEEAVLIDVTESQGVLGVMGPQSRALLQQVADTNLDHAAFPYAAARPMAVGKATALALRVTYVGELGWELHLPADQMEAAYDALVEAGRGFELQHAGHYAINSLRLEKGYRAWGAELSCDDTPFEAGLDFTLSWKKEPPFVGHDALLAQWETLPKKRMASLTLEDPSVMLWGNEPIYRDGQRAGYTSSGAFGHTLGHAVALGYIRSEEGVTPEYLEAGAYTIEVDGRRCPASLSLRAPYDPERRRILC